MTHHDHGTACHHHPAPTSFDAAFGIGIALNFLFVVAETLFGLRAHSLSLVADAAHNLGDVLGLGLAWIGYRMARRSANERFTFGYGRASIYTTVFNGAFLILSSLWIMYEAASRWHGVAAIDTPIVGGVALVGIVINTGTALALSRGHDDINIRGAWLHMLGDAALSAAVAVSAVVMHYTHWFWLDPLLSGALSWFVIRASWPLLREGLRLAMDGVPRGLDTGTIRTALLAQPHVVAVQDLRVWAVSTTRVALSAHVIIDPAADRDMLLPQLTIEMRRRFAAGAVTLQLENDHAGCVVD